MFKFISSDIYGTPSMEYIELADGERCECGEALKLVGGKLTKCGATDRPTHMCAQKAIGAAGKSIAATRINSMQIWETTLAAAGTALKVGDKVTLHTDGGQVTATTASGVAEITSIQDTALGGHVRVRL